MNASTLGELLSTNIQNLVESKWSVET